MLVLSAKHIKKTYGKAVALKDANIEIHKGEVLALLGANGSGKTTLIKILTGLLAKDSGSVEIMGYNLDTHENEIRKVIGYVGQDTERSGYARLTVRENLHFFGSLRGLNKNQISNRIRTISEYFDFDSNLDKQFMTLSGGQKQTTVIMRALLHNPPIIYLDEPTKGLDPIIAMKIRTFLKGYIKKEGKSMLLTSHILSEVDELADRISLIREGSNPITKTSGELKMAIGAKDFIDIQKDVLPASTIEKILKQDNVLFKAEYTAGWISFGVSSLFEGAEEIIRVLREDKAMVGFKHHTVSLEDAFVHHMGSSTEKFEI